LFNLFKNKRNFEEGNCLTPSHSSHLPPGGEGLREKSAHPPNLAEKSWVIRWFFDKHINFISHLGNWIIIYFQLPYFSLFNFNS